MINKEKIWNREKHWFTFKFSLIFLLLALIMFVLSIISHFVFSDHILTIIFAVFQGIFFVIFIVPILMYFNI